MFRHAALALVIARSVSVAAAMTFRRPGGETVSLLPWELVREESARHEACNVKILDAEDPAFNTSWLDSYDEPVLIKNLIGHWKAPERWTPEWFRESAVEELNPSPIKAWNFTETIDPQCTTCDWTERWGLHPLERKRSSYFDEWNVRSEGGTDFKEPNGVIFDPGHDCDTGEFDADAPTPAIFRPFCGNRHVAFAALGTSHGLHRHSPAWQAQVAGFKSWYLLPSETYTEPENLTTAGSPFGFPHELKVQRVNSLCGYLPSVPEVRDRIRNCVQGPGETMFVPNAWWHGTCSLDEYSVGTGGGLFQGLDVRITFANHVPVKVLLLYLDARGEEMHLETINPNAEVDITTYKDHVFRFVRTDNGQYVGEFVCPGGPLKGKGDLNPPYTHHIWPPVHSEPEL